MPDTTEQTTDPAAGQFWRVAEGKRLSELTDTVYPTSTATDAKRAEAWGELAEQLATLARLAREARADLTGEPAEQLDRWQGEYERAREQFTRDYRRNHGTYEGAELAWHASHTRELMMSRRPQPTTPPQVRNAIDAAADPWTDRT